MSKYDVNELKKALLYHKVIEWDSDHLLLDDGSKVAIECTEQDCCADAWGEFKDVKLDAVITDVKLENERTDNPWGDEDETVNSVDVVIYHNRNRIATAECNADNGNGGYYYSVGAVRVKDVYYTVVDC
ncbi:hypothetical protein CG419_03910 [Latilactobacillus curvatus]|uniref:DUF7448 domain-containing protein n=1 Tax=Latilactobacillus curvatus TaxID=28038 RepID=A0AAC9Y0E5_LATCU|nr:hypothetical protein [Latilactobacillus curvatus]ASN59820.1 hypothetical protein CG419_03910 [Latilactobacillus curvatus]